MLKPLEGLQRASPYLFPCAYLHPLDTSRKHSIQSLVSWTSATTPRNMVYASSTPSRSPQESRHSALSSWLAGPAYHMATG